MRVVESWNEVLMSGITMWVGAESDVSAVVTRQLAGRKAACVVMPKVAAKSTLMSGR